MNNLNDIADVDPFQFQKKSFAYKRKDNHYSSSSDDDEDEWKSRHTGKKPFKRKYLHNIESDSDSDIDLLPPSQKKKKKKNNNWKVAKKVISTEQNPCIDILDSSEDDDDSDVEMIDGTANAPKIVTACDALKKAHEAREKLKKAQKTLFIDTIDIDIDENGNFPNTNSSPHNSNINILQPQVIVNSNINTDMGPVLKINLITSNNEKQSFKIRSKEPFQNLMTSFFNRHNLINSSKTFNVHFKVDGETIPLTNTPNFYDLEDEDQIEVLVKDNQGKHITIQEASKLSNTAAAETNHTQSTNDTPLNYDQVVLKTFIHPPLYSVSSSNQDLWQIRSTDPFQKLVNAFGKKKKIENLHSISLQYGNKHLDWNSTPRSVGMKSGNTLAHPITLHIQLSPNDMIQKKSNNHNDAILGNKLTFKLRVNGNDKDIQEFAMGHKNHFEFLIQQFRNKNNTNNKKVKFILDGDTINPKASPMSEDLEGGEIIDVIIKETNPHPGHNDTNPLKFNDQPLTVQTIRNKVCLQFPQISII